MATLENALDQLDRRGAKESLVLMGDRAFVVGVPNRTVITVVDRSEAMGTVFTNIDSTFVA
jgi:flagellar operon protein